MGFYWQTFVCYGFYTTNKDIKLKIYRADWLLEIEQGVFVFVPKTYYNFPSIDTIIEEREVEQGFVSLNEVLQAGKLNDDHFEIRDKDKKKLEELFSVYPSETSEMRPWIVETCWSSLGGLEHSLAGLCKKLPIQ